MAPTPSERRALRLTPLKLRAATTPAADFDVAAMQAWIDVRAPPSLPGGRL
jgi:hypothetical protein